MIFTIGHSTRTADEFLALLHAHAVSGIADVRTIPRSRRHPHFAREALAPFLAAHGIAYEHFPALGGLRKPRPDSTNGGWRHPAFRGYADHMQTAAFAAAVDALLNFAGSERGDSCGGLTPRRVAVMCAEARWWQCHRQLLSDALVARGVEVRHIMTPRKADAHELTAFARVHGSTVTYPTLV
jgi:uncharacterized protein (DUF488 family)